MFLRIFIASLTLFSCGYWANAAPVDEFDALLDEAWEWRLAENPVFASRLGDRRYNQRWPNLSIAAIEQRHETRRDFLRRLRIIDPASLSDSDQLNYDLFARQLQNDIDAHQFQNHLMPISQRGGSQDVNANAVV